MEWRERALEAASDALRSVQAVRHHETRDRRTLHLAKVNAETDELHRNLLQVAAAKDMILVHAQA